MPRLLHDEAEFGRAAENMVQGQLRFRGVTNTRVLDAMRMIPRHLFLAPELRGRAYEDVALPTLDDQTISQPYMVAVMSASLGVGPEDVVLEIGAGSGYQTMILAMLARRVVSIEQHAGLAEQARQRMAEFGITNVDIHVGDGTLGWPDAAPYDRILVTAGAPRVPQPLIDQLADPGRLIIPVGPRDAQTLNTLEKRHGQINETEGLACRFVPLVGAEGWSPTGGPTI
ncbi:protein-L-isoaspartate(D-aspartate) O-methyltransferase [Planctomycetales bacterium ZRK34]|nr:protein-L-isoaspartate(D-aspartate) O-methyltransferase [Planctomycetales bacterium ZRK34]